MSAQVSALQLREAVRDTFDRVANAPNDAYRFEVGPALAEAVGYPAEVLARFQLALETFTGLAYLHDYLGLRRGERVLDLGCGGGLDVLIAACAVTGDGAAVGLDVSDAMVRKARAIARRLQAARATFERGEAEGMPFDAETFDVVLVNGIFNLCPEKLPVAKEVHRVLKPAGRAVVAEITFTDSLLSKEVRTVDDWFR
jgi:arsenite methyltransferase